MSQCVSPGCSRNDTTNESQTMFLELLPDDQTWVTVCPKHVDHDHHTIELTDEVKEIPFDTLHHLIEELAE